MLILLHQYEVKWFPVIGDTQLVAKSKYSTRYNFARFCIPYESQILPIRGVINGKPLPHPVDTSFVCMLAEKVSKTFNVSNCVSSEIMGHIIFHYTRKIIGSPRKDKIVPRYSNSSKEKHLTKCLMLEPDLTTKSADSLYGLYCNEFRSMFGKFFNGREEDMHC